MIGPFHSCRLPHTIQFCIHSSGDTEFLIFPTTRSHTHLVLFVCNTVVALARFTKPQVVCPVSELVCAKIVFENARRPSAVWCRVPRAGGHLVTPQASTATIPTILMRSRMDVFHRLRSVCHCGGPAAFSSFSTTTTATTIFPACLACYSWGQLFG